MRSIKKESLFKRETVKPALRVDCVYIVQSRKYGQERIRTYLVHIEFEEERLFEYMAHTSEIYALLLRKHKRSVVQLLVCPFQTLLPTPPYHVTMEDGELL